MKLFRKKREVQPYDRENKKPAIRASICHGEQTAGFVDVHTGKFEEIMLIRNPGDLEEFKATYGISGELDKLY